MAVPGVIAEAVPDVGAGTVVNTLKRSPGPLNWMYAITLHQPWATLIVLGMKNVETRSWPAPERLLGQVIAIHAGKRVVRGSGDRIERELRTRLGADWSRAIPAGAVVATATLAGMARVEYVDPMPAIRCMTTTRRPGAPLEGDEPPSMPGATSVPAAGYGSWLT